MIEDGAESFGGHYDNVKSGRKEDGQCDGGCTVVSGCVDVYECGVLGQWHRAS